MSIFKSLASTKFIFKNASPYNNCQYFDLNFIILYLNNCIIIINNNNNFFMLYIKHCITNLLNNSYIHLYIINNFDIYFRIYRMKYFEII